MLGYFGICIFNDTKITFRKFFIVLEEDVRRNVEGRFNTQLNLCEYSERSETNSNRFQFYIILAEYCDTSICQDHLY